MIHSHPRPSTLENLSAETIPTPSHGGPPPYVLQRICEHIEAPEEKISVDALATTSRAFRATFHSRLLAFRRIAAEYLSTAAAAGTRGVDASQHGIAAVGDLGGNGFGDQSHLTRHFHRLTGVAPSLIGRNTR
jgi:transcriptional regulator GlxA family with amidase domain